MCLKRLKKVFKLKNLQKVKCIIVQTYSLLSTVIESEIYEQLGNVGNDSGRRRELYIRNEIRLFFNQYIMTNFMAIEVKKNLLSVDIIFKIEVIWNTMIFEFTSQKMEFFDTDFFSKREKIDRELSHCSHLLKKFLTKKFIFFLQCVRLKTQIRDWKCEFRKCKNYVGSIFNEQIYSSARMILCNLLNFHSFFGVSSLCMVCDGTKLVLSWKKSNFPRVIFWESKFITQSTNILKLPQLRCCNWMYGFNIMCLSRKVLASTLSDASQGIFWNRTTW